MKVKIFVSYSHQDKDLCNRFLTHLSALEKSKNIDIWIDKNLSAGKEINEEIIENIKQSQIFIALVSPDYLSSKYCYETELKLAKEQYKNNRIKIIPIILSPCIWKSTDLLRDHLAIPDEGKPINKHEDPEEGFIECVQKIESIISDLEPKHEKTSHYFSTSELVPKISESFSNKLEDTEIVFRHKNKEKVYLSDIFVYPDLRDFEQTADDQDLIFDSSKILKTTDNKVTLILGGEQSGKMSLAKRAFIDNFNLGKTPIFIDCSEIKKKPNTHSLVSDCIELQYEAPPDNSSELVVVLANFHRIGINSKHQGIFLSNLKEVSEKIFVLSDTEIRYNDATFSHFSNSHIYEILRFSHIKKDKLITKWNTLGIEETIEEHELHLLNDQTRQHIDSIIRRNIVPSKPIYILTVLQTLESSISTDYRLTSYGDCYELLIRQSLLRARISTDKTSAYINYLSELAYFIYTRNKYNLNESELIEFQKSFSERYLDGDTKDIVKKLLLAGIIKSNEDRIFFSYRYIFYFYIAKYISDNINSSNVKEIVFSFCEKIHIEKHANILIFITHHTKNQDVLDEILLHASVIFDQRSACHITPDDYKHVTEILNSMRQLVYDQTTDIRKERKNQLKKKDELEGIDSDIISENNENKNEENEEIFSNETLAEINSSAKAIEIIGQILRNRHGDLTKKQLIELAESSILTGLRFLDFYLALHADCEEEILEFVRETLEIDPNYTVERIERKARSYYASLCYEVTFAIIKKIVFSNGSQKLLKVFNCLQEEYPESPALKLINVAMKLEFTSQIPFTELEKLNEEFQTNLMASRMLKLLVFQHLHLHVVSTRDRQRLSSCFKIAMNTQRKIQRKKQERIIAAQKA